MADRTTTSWPGTDHQLPAQLARTDAEVGFADLCDQNLVADVKSFTISVGPDGSKTVSDVETDPLLHGADHFQRYLSMVKWKGATAAQMTDEERVGAAANHLAPDQFQQVAQGASSVTVDARAGRRLATPLHDHLAEQTKASNRSRRLRDLADSVTQDGDLQTPADELSR